MKPEIARIIYHVIHHCHDRWRGLHEYRYNNAIIGALRNRLSSDATEWYEVHIKKRLVDVPEDSRCPRDISADVSVRRFRGTFETKPCEICGFDRAPNVAHIIPKVCGGPDDDWNLVHLCANHHYLFDRGLLTRKEYEAIDWREKGTEARYYADKVRLRQHEISWQRPE